MVPPNYGGMWCALELRSFSHGYGQITYHIVLVPKYRYKIFYERQVKKDCELIINDICKENGYRIHAMEIVEDHVHLFLEFHPTISLSKVVQYLKGSSSYRMFKRHPELKKRYWGGSLWSSGKFFRSVGNVTADTISHYIKESQGKQKAEHQLRKSKASGQLRLDDFWIPKNRARGPKHTPSFRAGWPRAVWFFSGLALLPYCVCPWPNHGYIKSRISGLYRQVSIAKSVSTNNSQN